MDAHQSPSGGDDQKMDITIISSPARDNPTTSSAMPSIPASDASSPPSSSSSDSSSSNRTSSPSTSIPRTDEEPLNTQSKGKRRQSSDYTHQSLQALGDDVDADTRALIQATLQDEGTRRSSRASASIKRLEHRSASPPPQKRSRRQPKAIQVEDEAQPSTSDVAPAKPAKRQYRRKSQLLTSIEASTIASQDTPLPRKRRAAQPQKSSSASSSSADPFSMKARTSSSPLAEGDDADDDASSARIRRPRRSTAGKTPRYNDYLIAFPDEDASHDDDDDDDRTATRKRNLKPTAKSGDHAFRPNSANFFFQLDGKSYEYQHGRCQQKRYSKWPRCSSCVAKSTGDLCRFIGIRVFPVDATLKSPMPFDPEQPGAQSHAPFLASEAFANVHFDYPSAEALFPASHNESIASIKAIAAQSLLPTMQAELDHALCPNTLWRKPEIDIRPQCDFCLTSLFSSSYICRCCAREYCLVCVEEMKSSVDGEEEGSHSRFVCRFNRRHNAEDLVPLTRLRLDEVQNEVQEMQRVIAQQPSQESASTTGVSWRPPEELTKYKGQTGPEVDRIIGSHTLTEYEHDVDEGTFRQAWAQGDPIVIHNCIPELRKASDADTRGWGPWSFTEADYTTQQCWITRCDEDNTNAIVTVADFFSTFGQDAQFKQDTLGKGIWKLKDWPPSSAFDDTFPDLYKHFNAALPMPDYTRRDGRMNISAHFPRNANVPDLGPKMYNAWPSREDQRAKGSTRLHMDVADAVNIMYYAAEQQQEEGDECQDEFVTRRLGTAAWDIFPASDSHKIRHYLRATRSKIAPYEDPIHSQSHFLDSNDRRSLWTSYGVRSWRIYQRPGDAVFIPAGCAHQVCNLTDCMKIAVDFVSPENVKRCFQLTAEFRAMSNTVIKSWKEDVLQLKSMLWHAWRACRVMEGYEYGSREGGGHGGGVKAPDRMDRPIDMATIVDNRAQRGIKAKSKRPRQVRDKSAAVEKHGLSASARTSTRPSRSKSRSSADKDVPIVISDEEREPGTAPALESKSKSSRARKVKSPAGQKAGPSNTASEQSEVVVVDSDSSISEDDGDADYVEEEKKQVTSRRPRAARRRPSQRRKTVECVSESSGTEGQSDANEDAPAAGAAARAPRRKKAVVFSDSEDDEKDQNDELDGEMAEDEELWGSPEADAPGGGDAPASATPSLLSHDELCALTDPLAQTSYLDTLKQAREQQAATAGGENTSTTMMAAMDWSVPTAYEQRCRGLFDEMNSRRGTPVPEMEMPRGDEVAGVAAAAAGVARTAPATIFT